MRSKPLKAFGPEDAEGFRTFVYGTFSPYTDDSKEERIEYLAELKGFGAPGFAELVKAFAEFLRDPWMTLEEKAEVYLEEKMSENRAYAYFKECWEMLAPGEPFPIDSGAKPPATTKEEP